MIVGCIKMYGSNILSRIKNQYKVFSDKPSLYDTDEKYPNDLISSNKLSINVWRNHNFEVMNNVLNSCFDYSGFDVHFNLSDYDDSFSFYGFMESSLEIIWINSEIYKDRKSISEWIDWLVSRISELRAKTTSPIIVISWNAWSDSSPYHNGLNIPGVFFVDLNEISRREETILLDHRTSKFSGTPISRKIQPIIARYIAFHWVLGVLSPPIKALALDLDNTLHDGVLGEDGLAGVSIHNGFKELQEFCLELKNKGIFLILVSKNDINDVSALFNSRVEYPLGLSDFSVVKVSWDGKSKAIMEAASDLNIAVESILFVDDNIGELYSVSENLPEVKILHANGAIETLKSLELYPGLWRWQKSNDDQLRIDDMAANKRRQELIGNGDTSSYLRSLGVSITININESSNIARLAELSGKTNQFNLSILRLNQVELVGFMNAKFSRVISISLEDSLSNSGTIALLVAEKVDRYLIVRELCVSCRALGRGLETDMIFYAIKNLDLFYSCDGVKFIYKEADRNSPVRNWLSGVSDYSEDSTYVLSKESLIGYSFNNGIVFRGGVA